MEKSERSEPTPDRREAARSQNLVFAYRLFATYKAVNIALLQYGIMCFMRYLDMMQYLNFYERVKTLVKSKKTTIEYVVGEAGLSLASYNAYRRHENLPRADEALKIAQVLGTTVEYLLIGDVTEQTASEKALGKIQIILDEYNKKPDKHK